MRAGTLLGVLLLVVGAILFAPRLGPEKVTLPAWIPPPPVETRFGKPCGMPAFTEMPRASERIQTMVVFRNQKTFQEYVRWTGRAVGRLDDSWYHEKRGLLLWCRQGLARMLCAVSVSDEGKVEFCVVRPDCLEIIRRNVRGKKHHVEWPDFLRVSTTSDLQRKAFEIGLNRMAVQQIEADFLARSWAFVHFLWHHEEGKYRERLLEYLRGELRGKSGYYYWAKIWAPTSLDRSPLEKEFEAWLKAACEKAGVK